MESDASAMLPREYNTKEEIYAKLLEDPSISIDVKNKISDMCAMWKLSLDEMKAENESLKKALLSYGSYFLPKELDIMILERTNAMDLKQVALVKRTWRSYIAANALKMRACIVNYIRIEIPSRDRPFRILKLADSMPVHHQYKKEKRVSLSELLHYQPQGFLKFAAQISKLTISRYNEQLEQIRSFPDWWFKRIKKVECSLKGGFVDRFQHLSELCVYTDEKSNTIEHLVDFIQKAPVADSFAIRLCNENHHLLVDEVLEAFIRKSLVQPAEFPTFAGKSSFTIAKIIRFIEANRFKANQTHRIHIFSPIIGRVEEWNEWLRCNANELQYFHANGYDEKLVAGEISYTVDIRWKFLFRGEYFDVVLDSFAA